ncbi:hypothetical protein FANTH_13678 [Fusarium anthophilum]|uniref:FAD-dependent urate hydroxylase HpyO/Asp monooxygenase CreE-like FAD/NAD(P)-binding domain-containing protein n=1 Tax=Fusarium anthophilum TaxID=48485 RepID=A0A8H5DPD7_9HYPO|nr:hypothetical protein FANTH_13678 [Fusarium anthophilum]
MSPANEIQIAIVGAGPRGTSCLERLYASASELLREGGKLTVHIIDPYPPGPGRVWRVDQPPRLLMNIIASQVTLFTDGSVGCKGPHGEEHQGPSLYDWGKDADGFNLGPKDYPTRSQHGLYLQWAFDEIRNRARKGSYAIDIKVHRAKAVKLDNETERAGGFQVLTLAKCPCCDVAVVLSGLSAVILTQGHVDQLLDDKQQRFVEHAKAKARSGIRYFPPGNPADINFDAIGSGENVVLRGLGLVFFDYMILLTARRGGWFQRQDNGSFKYHKSGNEPMIYASSRRGIPYHTKGDDQKGLDQQHLPVFLTKHAVEDFRQRALNQKWPKFREEVWPLISKEVRLVYYKTLIRNEEWSGVRRESSKTENDILNILREETEQTPDNELSMVRKLELSEADAWSWDVLEKPQGSTEFSSMESWNDWLRQYLTKDVEHAKEGNVNNPVKAALDVLREIRNEIRLIVSNRGLEQHSYKEDLIDWFTGYNSFLSVGPPRRRVEQMISLMEAGVLQLLGPGLDVETREDGWLAKSKIGERKVQTVIDAAVPPPKLNNTADELLGYLYETKQCQAHRIGRQETGAIDITEEPYNIVEVNNKPHPRRFALGVPAEGVHWATTIQPRPFVDSISLRQTDAVARAALNLAAKDQSID